MSDYRTASQFLNIHQTDIVCVQHEYGIFGGPTGSHLLKLLGDLRMPVVTTLHTVLKDPTPEYRAVMCKLSDLSDKLVVMSQKASGFLKDIYAVPEEKIVFIHHGIDMQQFDFQPAPDDTLLFFGRIHQDKGTREAIEIARACNKKLILAGIIQDQTYFDQYVASHVDDDKVVYIGSVGSVERNRLLGKALALLHPIQFDEPFGLSVVESMACGTPVIAFDRGSMPELIEDGKSGFLVDNVEAAVEAVVHVKAIDRATCRHHVQGHSSVDRMADEYIKAYEMILRGISL